MPARQRNEVNGVLLVDKPGGWTSYDVVNFVKHNFNVAKIGHCGTLDPLATGLLVLILGKATKLQDRLMSGSKVYEGSLRLGVETDTEDGTGVVTAEHDSAGVTEGALLEAMASFSGEISQVPPMVSAIKKNGTPLYELARKGITIEREARKVTIFSWELLQSRLPEADFRVHCSKGTYVRTLCADLGRKLGCGGIMTALRRTRCGHFSLGNAVGIEQLKSLDLEALRAAVIPPEAAVPPGA